MSNHTVQQQVLSMVPITVSTPKQAILDTARSLFVQHGYEGLSIRDLADHCGVAKATIYHHFQDKQALFMSVLERDVQMVHERLTEAALGDQDCLQKLHTAIHIYCALMSERRSIMLSTMREICGMEVQLREFMQRKRDLMLGPMVTILEQGIAAGVFRPVDVEKAALSLLGMLHGFITFQLLLQNVEIDKDVAENVYSLFLHGIVQKNS
jgi:AcrR family transcriptional regulator